MFRLILISFLTVCAFSQHSENLSDEFDCEGKPSDVIFVLDASNSIWGPDFKLQLTFVNHVIRRFKIGSRHMNVGILTFSDRIVKQFDLKEFKRKSKVRAAVKKIQQNGGIYTHTADAIRYMRKEMFMEKVGHRPSVFKIGIVITDGQSSNTTATALEAKAAREDGIHMFSIGVGRYYDINELYNIASEPSRDYVFRARNYRTLDRLKNLLAVKACSVTDPPTTPSPTTTPFTTTTATTTTTPEPTATTTPPTTTTQMPLPRTVRILTPPPTVKLRTELPDEHVAELKGPGPYVTGSDGRHINRYGSSHPFDRDADRKGRGNGDGTGKGGKSGSEPPQSNVMNEKNQLFPSLYHGPNGETLYRNIIGGGPCANSKPLDLVFVIDEKQGGARTLNNIWRWIRTLLKDLDMDDGQLRVRFIQECDTFPPVHLGTHRTKSTLLNAIDQMKVHHSRTATMLRQMSDSLSIPNTNSIGQQESRKVGIYITDGASGDLHSVLAEAQGAKLIHNVELYAVGVGRHVDPVELRALVSCEVGDHLYQVQHSSQLDQIKDLLLEQLCQDS